jgi:hypothetical protein
MVCGPGISAILGQGDAMSRVAARDAAAVLGVDTDTLATWRDRFGFPKLYDDYYLASDIEALRDAVLSEHSLPRAIEAARRRAGSRPSSWSTAERRGA